MLDTATARTALAREWTDTLDRLDALDPAGWDRPTRCAGWTVADLVRHTVWGVSMEADAVSGARARRDTPADGTTVTPSAGVSVLTTALRAAAADLVTGIGALTPEDEDAQAPMPYGPVPLPMALTVFVMEAGVHGSDLAHALGEPDVLAPDVVAATATSLAAFVPLLASNGSGAPDGAVLAAAGPSVDLRIAASGGSWAADPEATPTATVRGSDSDVLLYVLGRIPVDAPGLTVEGDTELAARFKQYVPGP
ncbi:maleylpyruvate isomerase family mycothiol-dependent enzyme [Pseudonocardia endophytica]|uniref:Uncharacterized protein (TIGR03086 family) n=1 Tax=Pseudonocardia endophytica TaxID=401976 RepID=A0A4R1HVS0_PSEEN|nr:maleylpyruvate isomerase family mycothiol-dependent enzyme [Pseudonocardia endophytica]TCK21602.1 uncharacterized protein (TIGR03086 family) [Pseudonocardia endophytica]